MVWHNRRSYWNHFEIIVSNLSWVLLCRMDAVQWRKHKQSSVNFEDMSSHNIRWIKPTQQPMHWHAIGTYVTSKLMCRHCNMVADFFGPPSTHASFITIVCNAPSSIIKIKDQIYCFYSTNETLDFVIAIVMTNIFFLHCKLNDQILFFVLAYYFTSTTECWINWKMKWINEWINKVHSI